MRIGKPKLLTYPDYLLYTHEVAENVNGGIFAKDAWRTAPFNTEKVDTANLGSLASNQITLAAGSYLVNALSFVTTTNYGVKSRFWNVTDSAIVAGVAALTSNWIAGTGSIELIQFVGKFTITATKVLALQHYCIFDYPTDVGFGFDPFIGASITGVGGNCYRALELTRVD